MTAKDYLAGGTSWTDNRARAAFPILLMYAKTARKTTYKELDMEIAKQNNEKATPIVAIYGKVLEKVGQSIIQLSQEWHEDIPPLTILVVNTNSEKPGPGVDDFLQRYVAISMHEQLTKHNRTAMIERATNAVHNYSRWDEVAAYFKLNISGEPPETEPIPLPPPKPIYGGESKEHIALKNEVASHPEWFKRYGDFGPGDTEFQLDSGDEVDVLFRNAEQALVVEVKTDTATPGEITRGIYQCVKYRAVLRAMFDIRAELVHVQTVLVTPQALPIPQQNAARRLKIKWYHPGK